MFIAQNFGDFFQNGVIPKKKQYKTIVFTFHELSSYKKSHFFCHFRVFLTNLKYFIKCVRYDGFLFSWHPNGGEVSSEPRRAMSENSFAGDRKSSKLWRGGGLDLGR